MENQKEFNLSEKIYNKNQGIGDSGYDFIHKKDIKEFIKRLKAGTKLRQMIDGHSSTDFIFNNFVKDIDILSGDKLI